jgi:hypothetical protein
MRSSGPQKQVLKVKGTEKQSLRQLSQHFADQTATLCLEIGKIAELPAASSKSGEPNGTAQQLLIIHDNATAFENRVSVRGMSLIVIGHVLLTSTTSRKLYFKNAHKRRRGSAKPVVMRPSLLPGRPEDPYVYRNRLTLVLRLLQVIKLLAAPTAERPI